MKCQILFSGKNKKNIINLYSADLARRVVKVNWTSRLLQAANYSSTGVGFWFIVHLYVRL